jgi:hypothetical protein
MVELAHAALIQTTNLPVDNGVLHGQFGESGLQRFEPEILQVALDQLAIAVLQVHHRAEAVVLQFEDVIGIVKGLFNQPEPHRANAWKHKIILSKGAGARSSGAMLTRLTKGEKQLGC